MPTEADLAFGEIALKHKLLTKKQHDEALKALQSLEAKLKKDKPKGGKGKPKAPRLLDVLVQKKVLNGRQAKSVENARAYHVLRLQDKLYGRIALKSRFVKPAQIEAGLEKQKKSYLKGDDPVRLAQYLIDQELLTEEQDEAIQGVMKKLDAREYVARGGKGKGGKGKGKAQIASEDESEVDLDADSAADEDDASDDDLEEVADGSELDLDDDLEEVDLEESDAPRAKGPAGKGPGKPPAKAAPGKAPPGKAPARGGGKAASSEIDLDLDEDLELDDDEDEAPRKAVALESAEDVAELDSQIDVALSDLDEDLDEISDISEADDADPAASAPRGLSSDVDVDLDDDDDDAMELDDEEISLDDDSDEKPAKKAPAKKAPAKKAPPPRKKR